MSAPCCARIVRYEIRDGKVEGIPCRIKPKWTHNGKLYCARHKPAFAKLYVPTGAN